MYCFQLKTGLKQCHDSLSRNRRFSSHLIGALGIVSPILQPYTITAKELLFGEVSKLIEGHLEALIAICELPIVVFDHILVILVHLETSTLKDLAATGYNPSI